MPNEPVQCPNCGSGDVRQLAADSYACEHCQKNFRWVNPTKITVAHEQKLCACGRIATAFCYHCGAPLCKEHERVPGGKPAFTPRYEGLPEWMRAALSQETQPMMCRKCALECMHAAGAYFESLRAKAKQEGKPCVECFSEDVQVRCKICGAGCCRWHGIACERCHQVVCRFCVGVGGGQICQTCRDVLAKPPKPWIVRFLFGD